MTSILNVEEATRRLEKIQEHESALAQMVPKLDDLSNRLSSELDTAAEQSQALNEAIDVSVQATESLRELGQQLVKDSEALEQQLEETLSEGLAEQASVFVTWADKRQEEWSSFRDEHFGQLETVTQSYERLRVVFDTVKTNIESVEESTEQRIAALKNLLEQQLAKMKNLFDESQEAAKTLNDETFCHFGEEVQRIDGQVDDQAKVTQTKLAALTEEHELLNRRLATTRKRGRIGLVLLFLGLGTLVTLLLVLPVFDIDVIQETKSFIRM
jgi:phage gp37-like protein